MGQLTVVFAYLGPETMLPMTSVVAGVVGIVMMFGRNAFRRVAATCRRLVSRMEPKPKVTRGLRRIGTGPVGRLASRPAARERVER